MIKKFTLAAVCAIGFSSSVYAASIQVDDVEAIFEPDEESIELFMKISNNGSTADTLIKIKSNVAASAVINTTSEAEEDITLSMGGDITMASSLEIMPGELVLNEDGTHLMLVDTNTEFKGGEMISFTLLFEKAGLIEVTAQVQLED